MHFESTGAMLVHVVAFGNDLFRCLVHDRILHKGRNIINGW